MRWCSVASCWAEDAGYVLAGLRREFDNVRFKFGSRYEFGGEPRACRTILALVPTPHPNAVGQQIHNYAYRLSEQALERRRKKARNG